MTVNIYSGGDVMRRREEILLIVGATPVHSQDELLEALRKRGVRVWGETRPIYLGLKLDSEEFGAVAEGDEGVRDRGGRPAIHRVRDGVRDRRRQGARARCGYTLRVMVFRGQMLGKYRIVDFVLSNFINSGLDSIYVLTQFLSVSLHRHIANTYKFDMFNHGFVEILAAQKSVSGSRKHIERAFIHFQN